MNMAVAQKEDVMETKTKNSNIEEVINKAVKKIDKWK